MSFGFGFALPAYPLRGGGGNNPFNQLGPTLDLSFVGGATNVGDLSNPNGYTLNTNFITPQYQVAAQYVVWETGVGLVDKTFSQIVTFSRTSGATWFNSAGVNVGIDFSTSSVAIGTGSKSFTLDATAGVNRSWTAGDIVRISEQATPANFMDGTVTSYTASTQTLVVNVTATGGSGTIASWRVSNWMPRFDYNPATLAAQGLLIEEARTNSIRNNTMQGAVAGTPGTLPTNWGNNLIGLTRTVVGTGTENGITYVDIRVNGTTTGQFGNILLDGSNITAAVVGQVWTNSAYLKLVAGSTTNISSVGCVLYWNDAAAAFISASATPATLTSSLTRFSAFGTAPTNTAFVQAGFYFNTTAASGQAVDFTLRIGLPQLEQGAFATSVIPTTTTALTRSQDRAVVNTLSPWFNATTGTIYAEFAVTQPVSGGNQFLARFSDSSYNNSIADNVDATGFAALVTASGGVFDGSAATAGILTANTVNKFAGAYASNDLAASRNGGTVATDTTATIPSGMTRFDLGSDHLGFNNIKAGYLRRITYYPRRLSNAELVSITT